jgi:hypothetical protein
VLILCFAVFAWGLQYKLSLYKTAHPIHPTNVAKLIQGEQRHRTGPLHSEWSRSQSPEFPVRWTIAPFRPLIALRRQGQSDEFVMQPAPIREMHDLLFRPPPQQL